MLVDPFNAPGQFKSHQSAHLFSFGLAGYAETSMFSMTSAIIIINRLRSKFALHVSLVYMSVVNNIVNILRNGHE